MIRLLTLLGDRAEHEIPGDYLDLTYDDLEALASLEADARECPVRSEVLANGSWRPLFTVAPKTPYVEDLEGGEAR